MQISVENINNLLIYFQNTVPRGNVTPFEVKGPERGNCSFQLTNSGITQTGMLTLSGESAKVCVTRTQVIRLSKTCRMAKYSLDSIF